jgi:bifunctional ADP-heptose synthase (sugar kinase/adenylyltransferase)
MTPERFDTITSRYPRLRLAVIGDFCLDRYFDIDPGRCETSIETGLPVHNVTRVRCQPGAAGTILNNLVALGIGTLFPVGFCGDDGEGWSLRRALTQLPGVQLDAFVTAPDRHTFTYSKPLLHHPGRPPEELSRLDQKNWTATPELLAQKLAASVMSLTGEVDGSIVMDQVDFEGTGTVTREVLRALAERSRSSPGTLILADSRRGLGGWPPLVFKMNASELAVLTGRPVGSLEDIQTACIALARSSGRPAFVTLSERGILGATAEGESAHVPNFPIRGPIDIVGAGDAVSANLTAALAAGASVVEAMEIAMAAAHLVIHQLGTTGTASVPAIRQILL